MKTEAECFEQGYKASQAGKDRKAPYDSDSYQAEAWYSGYDSATTDDYPSGDIQAAKEAREAGGYDQD